MNEISITPEGPDTVEFIGNAMERPDAVYGPETAARFRNVAERPPGMINIDASTLCNLRCGMCLLWSGQNAGRVQKRILDYGLFIKIIDDIAEYCPRAAVSLTPRGELFCHPRAMDIIREIKKRGLHFGFVTNGTLFGPDEVQEMINLPVDEIRFSVDALLPETYEKIRGADKHHIVIGNIWETLQRRVSAANGGVTRVNLNFVLQNLNVDEVIPFVAHWAGMVNEIQINKWDTDTDSPLNINNINRNFPKPDRYFCIAPWRDLSIDSDGNVYPCCYDPFVTMNMGSLRDKSLREIWLGERYMRLRSEILRGEFDEFAQCRDCGNWNLSVNVSIERFLGNLLIVEEYFEMTKYKFGTRYPRAKLDFSEYEKQARRLTEEHIWSVCAESR